MLSDFFSYYSSCETAVRLAPKITETLKGKLRMGARILQVGGVEKIFKQLFSVREEEKLLKASQCYLSTTAGPIAGLLFISTDKIAFCSDKAIKFSCPNGEVIRVHYKVIHMMISFTSFSLSLSLSLSLFMLANLSNINFLQVLIPVRKITTVNQSENVKKPSQKYIDIVTTDNFEFWFMGFIDYQRAFKYLQQAVFQAEIVI